MPENTFTIRAKPATVARKAITLMKRTRVRDANLSCFEIVKEGHRLVARARSDSGIFHDSEVRVEIEDHYSTSSVTIVANDDKTKALVARLRKNL